MTLLEQESAPELSDAEICEAYGNGNRGIVDGCRRVIAATRAINRNAIIKECAKVAAESLVVNCADCGPIFGDRAADAILAMKSAGEQK